MTGGLNAGNTIQYPILDRPKRQFSQASTLGSYNPDSQSLSWYNTWLASQFEKLPSSIFDIFPLVKDRGEDNCSEYRWQPLISAFRRIEQRITLTSAITIDEVIARLYDEGLLELPATDNATSPERHLKYARYFVFCALGWQTMLFTPAPFDDGWESPHEQAQLAINERDGCCGYTHMSLQQDSRACSNEPLSEFLMGFGVLLPAKNMCLDDDLRVQKIFQQQTEIHAKTFNAYTLSAVAGIRIKWVDALACHLEFNSTTREVSLFRFPSFCQAMLVRSLKGHSRAPIHACATTSTLRCQWATEDEINQLLVEILLSYRLLFRQTRRSRAAFRSSSNPFLKKSAYKDNIRDPLLPALCGTETPHQSIYSGMAEKEMYYLPRDFPVLRYRISVLQGHLSNTAPRTWLQLWRDNRDSASWLTFWAVIIFGAFGSLMAFLQVVLQLVQLVMQ